MRFERINWLAGGLRVWAVGATSWLVYSATTTDMVSELSYALRYTLHKDELRQQQIADGACVPIDYAALLETPTLTPPPSLAPIRRATDAEQNCRLHLEGTASMAADCRAVYERELKAAQAQAVATAERKKATEQQLAANQRALCERTYEPAAPMLGAVKAALLPPTLGVVSALALLVAFAQVARWVLRGFRSRHLEDREPGRE